MFTYEETTCLICTCKMCQEHLWESDISKKDASQWPASLLTVSFVQNGFSHTLCWSKPISGIFGANELVISGLELLSCNPHYVTSFTVIRTC